MILFQVDIYTTYNVDLFDSMYVAFTHDTPLVKGALMVPIPLHPDKHADVARAALELFKNEPSLCEEGDSASYVHVNAVMLMMMMCIIWLI